MLQSVKVPMLAANSFPSPLFFFFLRASSVRPARAQPPSIGAPADSLREPFFFRTAPLEPFLRSLSGACIMVRVCRDHPEWISGHRWF